MWKLYGNNHGKTVSSGFLVLVWTIMVVTIFFVAPYSSPAREFRSLKPIPTPQAEGRRDLRAASIRPLSREVVDDAVARVMVGWNAHDLAGTIGDDFYGRDRLQDVMATEVPGDAQLRIMAVEGVQLLDQSSLPGEDAIVSRVSVTVETQLEYVDPVRGFTARPGRNELILEIQQQVGGE